MSNRTREDNLAILAAPRPRLRRDGGMTATVTGARPASVRKRTSMARPYGAGPMPAPDLADLARERASVSNAREHCDAHSPPRGGESRDWRGLPIAGYAPSAPPRPPAETDEQREAREAREAAHLAATVARSLAVMRRAKRNLRAAERARNAPRIEAWSRRLASAETALGRVLAEQE